MLTANFLLPACLLFATAAFTQTAPAIQWKKCFGGTLSDGVGAVGPGECIKQTADGGYIVAGTARSNNGDVSGNHGVTDYWITKLNDAGAIEWQKCLGGSLLDEAYSIQQTSDGGYIVSGITTSSNGDVTVAYGDTDYWIVKLSSTGSIEWQKSLGGSRGDYANSVQQTTDGGYIVAGTTFSFDFDVTGSHGQGEIWIVKLNGSGTIQWKKCLGGSGWDERPLIQLTADGGYIVAGETDSNDGDVSGNHGYYDYWVVKLSSTGAMQWQKCLGGSGNEELFSIMQTTGGGYIVAGYSESTNGDVSGNHGQTDYWVVKLSSTGAIEWQKCLGGSLTEVAKSVRQTSDGGYVVAGYTDSNDGDVSGNHGSSYNDYWVVKLSSTGTIQWQKCLGGTNGEGAGSINQTNDGGYIVAGTSDSNDGDVSGNHGPSDIWIVKLAAAVTGVNNITSSLLAIKVFPNPARGLSTFSFFLDRPGNVSIKIFDNSGQLVKTFADTKFQRGENKVQWNAGDVPAGVYLLKIETAGYTRNKKIIVLK